LKQDLPRRLPTWTNCWRNKSGKLFPIQPAVVNPYYPCLGFPCNGGQGSLNFSEAPPAWEVFNQISIMMHFKVYKKEVLSCLLLTIEFACTNVRAQDKRWPPANWSDTTVHDPGMHKVYTQSLKGFAVLNNGGKITGYMSLSPSSSLMLISGKYEATVVPSKNIKYIKADISTLGRNFTELYTLNIKQPSNSFWRLIERKGNVSIYDWSRGIFTDDQDKIRRESNISANEFNENMVLIKAPNGEPIRIYGKFSWISPMLQNKNPSKELILKFINSRYHQTFKGNDFKADMDLIDYILDKEQ
jgi:hypothetical protein